MPACQRRRYGLRSLHPGGGTRERAYQWEQRNVVLGFWRILFRTVLGRWLHVLPSRYLVHQRDQILYGIWFVKPWQLGFFGAREVGITSREDDWQTRADAADLIGELAAGHVGHRVVGYHEVHP